MLAGQLKKPEGLSKHKGTVYPAHEATLANRSDRMNREGNAPSYGVAGMCRLSELRLNRQGYRSRASIRGIGLSVSSNRLELIDRG